MSLKITHYIELPGPARLPHDLFSNGFPRLLLGNFTTHINIIPRISAINIVLSIVCMYMFRASQTVCLAQYNHSFSFWVSHTSYVHVDKFLANQTSFSSNTTVLRHAIVWISHTCSGPTSLSSLYYNMNVLLQCRFILSITYKCPCSGANHQTASDTTASPHNVVWISHTSSGPTIPCV